MFKQTAIAAVFLAVSAPIFAAEYWIDVRIPEQYQREHVQGAVNLPLKDIEKSINEYVPDKTATVYVYCNSGRQSGLAKETLMDMGYTQVFNAGGISRLDKPKVNGE